MIAKRFFLPAIIMSVMITGCAVSNKNYDPDKKYSRQELQTDYTLFRNILEAKHPSLYWYTPKDSMNYYFDSLYQNIADSMTEYQFGWQVLAPLTNKIHCGHTSFLMSNDWGNFIKKKRVPSFPLYLKVWEDTMVVFANLNKKDSVIKPGTLITSINNLDNKTTISKMLSYLPLDGFSENVNYVRISGNFPVYHRSYFGVYKNYRVGYIDSAGIERKALIPMYEPIVDTSKKKKEQKAPKEKGPSRREIRRYYRQNDRSFEIDTSINTAVISLNTFSKGNRRHLRGFFRRSFRTIRKEKIPTLILDLRNNGGGDIDMSALLAKYFKKMPFRVADSAYAVTGSLKPYTQYIRNGFFTNLGLFFLASRKKDGNKHFSYWENHEFNPKRKNHFNGQAYVLISGPTFSASSIFCNIVKGQDNITLAGEETGGGWHGNNGLMIPTITLPNTRLRVTLPIFRLVQYNHVPKDGRGVPPDIYIPPTVESVRRMADRKMEVVKEIIKRSPVESR